MIIHKKVNKDEAKRDACLAIGTAVAGLYFLSNQSKQDNIQGLTEILEQAISQSVKLGCEVYDEQLKQDFEAHIDDVCVFIENYCAISDPVKKKYLAEIVRSSQDQHH